MTELIIADIDFRGEQYFVRVYYEFPNQNTLNNMKELKKKLDDGLQSIEIKKNLQEFYDRDKHFFCQKESQEGPTFGAGFNSGYVKCLRLVEKILKGEPL